MDIEMKNRVRSMVCLALVFAGLSVFDALASTGNPPLETIPQGPCRAVVRVSAAYLRAAADYESPLETQELMGTVVRVLEKDRYWCKVESPQPYTAWCTDRTLVVMDSLSMEAYIRAPKYVCIAAVTRVLEEPRASSPQLCDAVLCDRLRVVFRPGTVKAGGTAGTVGMAKAGGTMRASETMNVAGTVKAGGTAGTAKAGEATIPGGTVKAGERFCGKPLTRGKYAAVLLPDGRQGWMLRSELMTEETWRATGCDLRSAQMRAAVSETAAASEPVVLPEKVADAYRVRASLVACAREFVGVPYLWGGMSPKGFDCSGLVRMVYLRYGLVLPRNASQMARLGREVKPEEMKPGDLLFFGVNGRVTHVGMYIGDGHFIHSSHLVRINAVAPDAPDAYENMYKFLFSRNLLD